MTSWIAFEPYKIKVRPDVRIIISREKGFCSGVQRAVSTAETVLQKSGVVAATDVLLHNAQEANRLREAGLRSVEELGEDELSSATILLPAHGSTQAERDARVTRAHAVIDLVCPIVEHAHTAAAGLADTGLPVVIVGDRGHRETRYLMEAAGRHFLDIVSSPDDLPESREFPMLLGLIFQTTQSREFRTYVLSWMHNHRIEVVERFTLCPEVLRRQDCAACLVGRCTAVLVLGDASSANTRRLVVVAAARCARTLLVEKPEDVSAAHLTCSDTVGILSGTSCPQTTIDAVVRTIRDAFPQASLEVI